MGNIIAGFRWDKEPFQVLEGMKRGLQTKILRKSMRQGVKILVPAVKTAAPKLTGALRVSVGALVKGKGMRVLGMVGSKTKYMRTKDGKKIQPSKYFHLVNAGTKTRTTKDGRNRGKVTATFFLNKVWTANKGRASQAMMTTMRTEISLQLAK